MFPLFTSDVDPIKLVFEYDLIFLLKSIKIKIITFS